MARSLSILCFIGILAVACKKEKPEETVDPFNKGTLLVNLADNLIIPALNEFQISVNTLETDYIQFQANRTSTNLDIVRNSWKEAYLNWQGIKMYDFGPIRDYGFKGSTGTYPTDTALVSSNISSGTYNLASASNADAIGFSALDFLLYQPDALNKFIANNNYTTYGLEVISKIKSETALVVNAWNTYRSTFITSTGTETTSAFSELVNEFNRDYELAKNAKVGIPIGKQSLGIQLPEYIEARYSGISFELLHRSIESLSKLYNGNSFVSGASGIGFDDYLIHLEKSNLSSEINSKFTAILNKISSFSGSLETEMATNVTGLDELYNLLQSQVVKLKTDMTSSFGVLITYQDNDGD